MKLTTSVDLSASPEALFPFVSDLAHYPRWLGIIASVVPSDPDGYIVELRGRLGPFARSKRLRMVQVANDTPRRAVFERSELDGREHAMWRLAAELEPIEAGVRLQMDLGYSGTLYGPVVERLLAAEIEQAKVRLAQLVANAE